MSDNWLSNLSDDLEKLSELITPSEAKTIQFMEGERREVAILFMDLKGFTALSEKMDHEALHKLIYGIMKMLSGVIEQHGGYVDKFEGDLVMALFGAQRASENDCIRSVQCGLRLFEAMADINKLIGAKLGIDLGARIGINFGWVTVAPDPSGHLTAMGDDVNLASRMESTAEVNTIQVTEDVLKQAGEYFQWQDLGLISVKGKTGQIHTYRPTGFGRIYTERWERSKRITKIPFIGRNDAIEQIKTAWNTPEEEIPLNPRGFVKHTLIGIQGEAGIGKSRFSHEFEKIVREGQADCLVLKGHTTAIAQPPFWMWVSVLKDYFGFSETQSNTENFKLKVDELRSKCDSETNALLDRAIPFITMLLGLPVSDPAFKQVDEKTRRSETILALRDFIRAIAQTHQRLALFLDDLHWMDSGSQEALEFILANCDTMHPIYFCCGYRPDREDGQQVTFQMKESYVRFVNIEIHPLPEETIKELIYAILHASDPVKVALPDEVERHLIKYSQGNPFYLEELLLDWIETGKLTVLEGKWQVRGLITDFIIPTSIASLVRARMDRLSKDERDALQQCAVLGFEFTQMLFRKVKDKIAEKYSEDVVLKELEFRNFLRSLMNVQTLSYRFRLTTTRNVAYDTILIHNRQILHRLTAEATEELFKDELDTVAEMLSIHWELAEDYNKAIDYGIRGLQFLRRSFQNRESYFLAERLLELLDNNPDKIERVNEHTISILFLFEATCEVLGKRDKQYYALDRLKKLVELHSTPMQMLTVKERYGNLLFHVGQFAEAERIYNEVLPLAQEQNSLYFEAMCIGNLGLISVFLKELISEKTKQKLAEEKNRSEGDRPFEAAFKKEFEDAMGKLLLAADKFHEAGEKRLEATFLMNAGGFLVDSQNRIEEAKDHAEKALVIFKQMRNRRAIANATANLGHLQTEPTEAIELSKQALTLFREIGDRRAEGTALANIGYRQMQLPESDEAETSLRHAIAILDEVQDLDTLQTAYTNLIKFFEGKGQYDKMIEAIDAEIPILQKVNKKERIAEWEEKKKKYGR